MILIAPELEKLILEGVCSTSRDNRFWQTVPIIYYSCTKKYFLKS